MENKKNNLGVVTIILSIIVLCLIGYIGYDKLIKKETNKDIENNTSTENETKKEPENNTGTEINNTSINKTINDTEQQLFDLLYDIGCEYYEGDESLWDFNEQIDNNGVLYARLLDYGRVENYFSQAGIKKMMNDGTLLKKTISIIL